MSSLCYISEDMARGWLEAEVESNKERGFIIEPGVFAQHHIDTGRIAYGVATTILQKHPSLGSHIDPDIVRVEGYLHDSSKIYEGNPYHEIGTAYLILTRGEEIGLVRGGSKSGRQRALRIMASLPPSDHSLYEQLGEGKYPDGVLYPDHIGKFKERIESLRGKLSKTDEPLTIEEVTLPLTLMQQIALYADLTNLQGDMVDVGPRLDEIIRRYIDPNGQYYDPIFVYATERLRSRALVVAGGIKTLME